MEISAKTSALRIKYPPRAALTAVAFFAMSFGIVSLFAEYSPHLPVSAPVSDETASSSGTSEANGWSIVKSAHFNIYLSREADLNAIIRRIQRRGSFFHGRAGASGGERIADSMDMIMKRVEDILDMHPRMPKLSIKIFGTTDELEIEYFKIFGVQARGVRSFYVNKHATIYTSENDITDSVIAHEMAHAVVDNYFSIVPPRKMAEIMASYVDVHLDEGY